MKKIFYVLLVLLLGAMTVEAQNKPLNYGDIIHLQNGWNNYGGGYLDTRGYQKDFAKTGNYLCVSTATGAKRDGGSGSWKVMSATGKANGSPVLVNDNIYLLNQWSQNGGYLDTRGYQKDYAKTGNHLCVSTAKVANRDSGSGTWRIISAKGSPAGTPVTNKSEIQLQNAWNRFQGGFLDTRGYQRDYAKTGNLLCVSTATGAKRDGGSGSWKVTIAQSFNKTSLNAGESLSVNDKLYSSNGAYYLIMQKDGNLCVYKTQGNSFVWCSMAHGFAGGKLTMQSDGNLCVYDKNNGFKWGSYQVKKYPLTAGCKLILKDDGKLNILNSSGKVVWSN